MPLTKPLLTKVTPGLPLTAGGWNAVLGSIGGLYDGLKQVSRDYIEVRITFRGEAVGDARVVGIPVDGGGKTTGPALAAVPRVGDIRSYQLVGIAPGTWKVSIAAEGFAPVTVNVSVTSIAPHGTSASTEVELKRTTIPVPDLIGMVYYASSNLLFWAGITTGIGAALGGLDASTDSDSHIVFQGPSDGEIPRGAGINIWYTGISAKLPPSRTVVPDFLGWPGANVYGYAAAFGLTRGQETGTGGSGSRVIAQNPPAGQIVAAGSAFDVSYSPADSQTTFSLYPTTHAALATRLVSDVQSALIASPDSTLAIIKSPNSPWFPWAIARTYLSDDSLKAVLDFFATQFKVTVSDPSKDLPAIWASLMVALHSEQPA